MEGTQSPDEFAAINRDNPASGECLVQDGLGPGVIGIVECRHEDD